MGTTLMEIPSDTCQPFEVAAGTFLERCGVADTGLISSEERLIRELATIIDRQMVAVLESRTSAEFVDTRTKVWMNYVRSVRALSDTASNLLSADQLSVLSELVNEAFKEDLEKQRGSRLSDALVDQMVFTIWAFGKIRSLGKKIHEAGEARDKDQDIKLSRSFQVYLLWAQFHMDCVAAAMKFRKSLPADIQEIIQDSLRAAVNVYAIGREALDLRRSSQDQGKLNIELPWDEEDEELLASSMRDINAITNSRDY